jgi:hypothetical protein
MKKIAFLFLVIDNPNFSKLWDSYFRGHKDKYNIYIHPKFPQNTIWKKNHIISNLQETSWGFITSAYIELMKEAFKDPENYKFITLSESCVPIQSFDNFYNDATSDERSWIKNMKLSSYNYKSRLNTQKTQPRPKHFIKNYARFCLNRSHVKLLLSKLRELEFFHKMHVGDEFFLSVLYPLKNYRDFAVTYDDWDYVIAQCNKIKEEKKILWEKEESDGINRSTEREALQKLFNNTRKNPKTIVNVEEDLEKIKSCDSYFYRKFAKESNIEKYWKGIIKAHRN